MGLEQQGQIFTLWLNSLQSIKKWKLQQEVYSWAVRTRLYCGPCHIHSFQPILYRW